MILTFNYEELRALESGARLALACEETDSCGPDDPSAEARRNIHLLTTQLNGAISLPTLAQWQEVRESVALICEGLHMRLEEKVVELHPAHEEAVALYFDYAHTFAVLNRLDAIGTEMKALIELMTGKGPSAETAASVTFPD